MRPCIFYFTAHFDIPAALLWVRLCVQANSVLKERSQLMADKRYAKSSIHAIDPGVNIGPVLNTLRYAFAFPSNSSLQPLIDAGMDVLMADDQNNAVFRCLRFDGFCPHLHC